MFELMACNLAFIFGQNTVHTHKRFRDCFEVRDGQRVSNMLTSISDFVHRSTPAFIELDASVREHKHQMTLSLPRDRLLLRHLLRYLTVQTSLIPWLSIIDLFLENYDCYHHQIYRTRTSGHFLYHKPRIAVADMPCFLVDRSTLSNNSMSDRVRKASTFELSVTGRRSA
jgi:hypothetical protein